MTILLFCFCSQSGIRSESVLKVFSATCHTSVFCLKVLPAQCAAAVLYHCVIFQWRI